jgi:hypothetical protein
MVEISDFSMMWLEKADVPVLYQTVIATVKIQEDLAAHTLIIWGACWQLGNLMVEQFESRTLGCGTATLNSYRHSVSQTITENSIKIYNTRIETLVKQEIDSNCAAEFGLPADSVNAAQISKPSGERG